MSNVCTHHVTNRISEFDPRSPLSIRVELVKPDKVIVGMHNNLLGGRGLATHSLPPWLEGKIATLSLLPDLHYFVKGLGTRISHTVFWVTLDEDEHHFLVVNDMFNFIGRCPLTGK